MMKIAKLLHKHACHYGRLGAILMCSSIFVVAPKFLYECTLVFRTAIAVNVCLITARGSGHGLS
jgi:hypothetical protein